MKYSSASYKINNALASFIDKENKIIIIKILEKYYNRKYHNLDHIVNMFNNCYYIIKNNLDQKEIESQENELFNLLIDIELCQSPIKIKHNINKLFILSIIFHDIIINYNTEYNQAEDEKNSINFLINLLEILNIENLIIDRKYIELFIMSTDHTNDYIWPDNIKTDKSFNINLYCNLIHDADVLQFMDIDTYIENSIKIYQEYFYMSDLPNYKYFIQERKKFLLMMLNKSNIFKTDNNKENYIEIENRARNNIQRELNLLNAGFDWYIEIDAIEETLNINKKFRDLEYLIRNNTNKFYNGPNF